MYQITLIISAAIVCVSSAPVNEDAQALILNYDVYNDGSGNYKFSYETSNGLTREETGEVVNVGREDEHIVVRGIYSYIDPDGNTQSVSYTADENGYRANPGVRTTSSTVPPGAYALPYAVVSSLLG